MIYVAQRNTIIILCQCPKQQLGPHCSDILWLIWLLIWFPRSPRPKLPESSGIGISELSESLARTSKLHNTRLRPNLNSWRISLNSMSIEDLLDLRTISTTSHQYSRYNICNNSIAHLSLRIIDWGARNYATMILYNQSALYKQSAGNYWAYQVTHRISYAPSATSE